MKLYKNKYRIASTRLKGNSYQEGIFFVTICTKKKLQWFGEIVSGKMRLSDVGQVVVSELQLMHSYHPNAFLDSSCVMPNHIHMIVRLINSIDLVETPRRGVSTSKQRAVPENLGVSTNAPKNSTALAIVINQWKGGCTKLIRNIHPEFLWQSRFHDHIVRSDHELAAIRRYIKSNPAKWDKETIPWQDDAYSYGL